MSALRAVFFDRDGVLNEDLGYVSEPDRLFWRPTAKEAVKWLNEKDIFAFVVTNQSGVARGFFDETAVRIFHERMQAQLAQIGARIDAFRFCPHHPEGAVAEFRRSCDCRKPAGGMIRQLLDEYGLDPAKCRLFGDKPTDMEAGADAGVAASLVHEGDLLLDLVVGAMDE